MKKIRNPKMANVALAVPGQDPVTGDADGVFALPSAFAERLLQTPGWKAVGRVPAPAPLPTEVSPEELTKAEAALAEKEAARAKEEAAAQQAEAEAQVVRADEEKAAEAAKATRALGSAEEPSDDDSETVDVDLDQLDKAGLLSLAGELGIEVNNRMTKAEIKEKIEAQQTEGD